MSMEYLSGRYLKNFILDEAMVLNINVLHGKFWNVPFRVPCSVVCSVYLLRVSCSLFCVPVKVHTCGGLRYGIGASSKRVQNSQESTAELYEVSYGSHLERN